MMRLVGIGYSEKKIKNKRNSRGDGRFGVNQNRDGKSRAVVSWWGFQSLKQYDVNRIVIARVLRRFENDPVVRKTIKDLCMIGGVYLHGSLVKIDAVEDEQINNKIDQLNDIDVLAIPMLSRREADGGVNQKLFDRPLKGYSKIDICVWRGSPEEYDYRCVGRTVKDSVLIEIDYKNTAHYDDELTIITKLIAKPTAKIKFSYEVLNNAGDIIAIAKTDLVFLDKVTKKPIRCPDYILNQL